MSFATGPFGEQQAILRKRQAASAAEHKAWVAAQQKRLRSAEQTLAVAEYVRTMLLSMGIPHTTEICLSESFLEPKSIFRRGDTYRTSRTTLLTGWILAGTISSHESISGGFSYTAKNVTALPANLNQSPVAYFDRLRVAQDWLILGNNRGSSPDVAVTKTLSTASPENIHSGYPEYGYHTAATLAKKVSEPDQTASALVALATAHNISLSGH
jgi:hypothetical protein